MNNVKRLNETTVEIDGDTYELKQKAFTLRPGVGDEYHYISDTGVVHNDQWNDTNVDNYRYCAGNIYSSVEKGLLERDARIKERELLDLIAERNHREGWVCDWSDEEQYKSFFDCYYHEDKEFESSGVYKDQYRPTSHYFEPELEQEIRAKFSHEDLRLIYCRERS